MEERKEHPKTMHIKMCGQQWGEINRLCSLLGLNPYDYAETNSKKAGLLIYSLSKCRISGVHKFSIPNPKDYK